MEEVKNAKCIGVRDIVRVNVECPHCGLEMEMPYEKFVKNICEPWTGDQEGHAMVCPKCEMYFELGEFELED